MRGAIIEFKVAYKEDKYTFAQLLFVKAYGERVDTFSEVIFADGLCLGA